MKKIISLILAVMLVISAAGLLKADVVYNREPGARIQISVTVTAQGQKLVSAIGVNNRVLGFTFADSSAGWCALYDAAASTSASSTNVFGEAYVAAGGVNTVMFPLPRNIANGVVVGTNNSTGTVMVYYE